MTPPVRRPFSRPILAAIADNKILRVRAGATSDHRFTGIWSVVVDGRVFVRSWTLKPGGWYRTFLEDPLGTIRLGEREIRVRAIRARGSRIRDAVERAYAEKYSTPASAKYVRGFRSPRRREATTELLPRQGPGSALGAGRSGDHKLPWLPPSGGRCASESSGGNIDGAVLQKLRNYGVRLAVVCPAGSVPFSSRFGEMIAEEQRRQHFGVFETRLAAREWLGRLTA